MIPLVRSCDDADRGRRGAEPDAHEQHAGNDVVDVPAAGVDRAPEQVDEHQHQQDRQRERLISASTLRSVSRSARTIIVWASLRSGRRIAPSL